MDRTANPLFKAGMAAITATTVMVAPVLTPPAHPAISLPDIRSATVRLSSLAFTPRNADVPVSPLAALKLPLSPPAAAAAGASTLPRALTPISPFTSAIQPRAAAPTGTAAQPRAASASATASPAVANSITNGIDQAYQFVQYWVDYGVNLAQWGAGFVPVIGGLVSAQIGIVYDNLVRPIANSFVYNLVDPIINDPSFSNIVNSFGRFGGDIVNSVINLAWAEVRYILPPLPPLPGLALQATTPADASASATVHEALAPFAKAFKDAEAHFAEALGLTKSDPKLTTAEKTGTAAQTSTESGKEPTKEISKEDGKTTEAASTTGAKETLDSKESSDGKTPAKDKTIPAVDVEKQASDKSKADGKETAITTTEVTKETVKDTPKEGATSTGDAGTSGEPVKTSKPVKETEDPKDSTKETTPAIGATTVDKQDKTVKAKVPTVSTTEHGAISAQGIVRGPVSQSTTSGQPGSSAPAAKSTESKVSEGKTSDTQKTDAAAPDTKITDTKNTDTKNTGTKTAETKTTDTKTSDTKTTDSKPKASETKSSESKTSNTKSSGTASAHDSASKSSGSGSNSSKSGGEGSKSGGGSHH